MESLTSPLSGCQEEGTSVLEATWIPVLGQPSQMCSRRSSKDHVNGNQLQDLSRRAEQQRALELIQPGRQEPQSDPGASQRS